MLVLSRMSGEEIVIDDNIVIQVVEVRGGKVRLGISADRDVPVHRKEVWDKIQIENNQTNNTGTVCE